MLNPPLDFILTISKIKNYYIIVVEKKGCIKPHTIQKIKLNKKELKKIIESEGKQEEVAHICHQFGFEVYPLSIISNDILKEMYEVVLRRFHYCILRALKEYYECELMPSYTYRAAHVIVHSINDGI